MNLRPFHMHRRWNSWHWQCVVVKVCPNIQLLARYVMEIVSCICHMRAHKPISVSYCSLKHFIFWIYLVLESSPTKLFHFGQIKKKGSHPCPYSFPATWICVIKSRECFGESDLFANVELPLVQVQPMNQILLTPWFVFLQLPNICFVDTVLKCLFLSFFCSCLFIFF